MVKKPDDDYIDLLNGEAAMSAIATADAATVVYGLKIEK